MEEIKVMPKNCRIITNGETYRIQFKVLGLWFTKKYFSRNDGQIPYEFTSYELAVENAICLEQKKEEEKRRAKWRAV